MFTSEQKESRQDMLGQYRVLYTQQKQSDVKHT